MFKSALRSVRFLTPRRLFWCGIAGGVSIATLPHFSPLRLDQPKSALDAKVEETVAVDSSISPFPLKLKPSNIVHKEYQLLGHGVRSVTFLGLKVYGIGIYVGSADIPAIQKVLGNLGTEDLKAAFKDPERCLQIVSQMIENKVDFLIRISPVRNTDFGHLGDGFIKSILASTIAKENREVVGAGLDELRAAFKSFKGSVPKNHLLILETAKGPLEITYHDPNTDTVKRLGIVNEPLISKALLTQYLARDGLVRQNLGTVDVDLVLHFNIVTQNSDTFGSGPLTNSGVPTNNGGLDPGVVLNLRVSQQDGSLDSGTFSNNDVRANDNIGTDQSSWRDFSSGVDQDVTTVDEWFATQLFWGLFGQGRQVQTGSRQEVLWLTDIHPVTLQVKRVQGLLLDQNWEGLLFNGGWLHLDQVNHGRVQDVQTSIDSVTNELDWLLNEPVNQVGGISIVNDNTVLGRFVDLRGNDSTSTTVLLVEVGQLREWVITDDVGVEDEERRVILLQHFFSQLQGTSSAQRFFFDRKGDRDTVLLLVLLQGGDHDLGSVVDGQHNVGDASSGQSLNLVKNHGSVAELHQGLGQG